MLAILAGAAPPESGAPVRLAVEIDWSNVSPAVATQPVRIDVAGGRVVGVEAWPTGQGDETRAKGDGSWTIGRGVRGRVRALLEAPIGSDLSVTTGDRSVLIPLGSILEGPQRLGTPATGEVGVERLAWDAIRADFGGDSSDGTAEPGALVPISLASTS